MKERLKELRKALGLKQRQIAERLGVRVGVVGDWEIGRNPIPKTRIYQICNEYNVNREWLESGVGDMFNPASDSRPIKEFNDTEIEIEYLLRRYRTLSPENQERFRDFVVQQIEKEQTEKEAVENARVQINNGTIGGNMTQN